MKKSVILSAILFGSMIYSTAQAQVSVHIGFNIPARRVYVPAPPPQPVMVYDNDEFDDSDDYYYLPEVEAYYSVPRHCYYYMDDNRWVSAAYLPGAYRNYDWRTARRFEIRGRRPYLNHNVYRNKWGGNFDRSNWGRRDNNFAGRKFNNDNRNRGYNRPFGNYRNRDENRGGNWDRFSKDRRNGNDDRHGWGQYKRNNGNNGRSPSNNIWYHNNDNIRQVAENDNRGRGDFGRRGRF